jgi:hypothetical protein
MNFFTREGFWGFGVLGLGGGGLEEQEEGVVRKWVRE